MHLRGVITTLFCLSVTVSSVIGQDKIDTNKIAFKDGETLTYVVSYKISLINTDLATVVFEAHKTHHESIPAYHMKAVAQVLQSYRYFFDMKDEYNTWLNESSLRPMYFNNNIKEGSYRFVSSMNYDWTKMVVNTQYKNLRIGIDYKKQMRLKSSSFDGLALFYNLRNTDLQEIKNGFKGYVELVLCDTIKRLEYKFLGHEIKNIPKIGKFKTLKFSCQLTSSTDNSFKDGSEFFIWFSDDLNKIPLYIESPIRVGSVKGRLESWKNLKYPLSSKIK